MRPEESIQVTAALLSKDGKFLITRRPEGSYLAGLWEFPGGKREAHETLEACLQREIREELGMDIRVDKLVLTVQHEYDRVTVTLHFFKCTPVSGSPKPLNGQEMKWVSPAEFPKYRFPPPDGKIIAYLASQNRNSA